MNKVSEGRITEKFSNEEHIERHMLSQCGYDLQEKTAGGRRYKGHIVLKVNSNEFYEKYSSKRYTAKIMLCEGKETVVFVSDKKGTVNMKKYLNKKGFVSHYEIFTGVSNAKLLDNTCSINGNNRQVYLRAFKIEKGPDKGKQAFAMIPKYGL